MTTHPTDLRQQAGACPECKGSGRTGSGYLREDCPACNGTGQQPAQPASLLRPAVVASAADCQKPQLVVTRGDGVPLPDQAAALAEFKRQCLQPAQPGSGEVCLCHLKSCGVCRYKTDVDKATELRDYIQGLHTQLTAAQQRIAALESENADLRTRLNHSERLQGRYPREA